MTMRAETEAEKLQRVPGIEFVDTPTGRMARPIGLGQRVWQIVQWLQGSDRDEFKRAFDHVTDAQIDAAELYYKLYPDEIDRRIAMEHHYTPEQLQKMYPNLVIIREPST
jgi:uncharacterized protein (DUF433 family)